MWKSLEKSIVNKARTIILVNPNKSNSPPPILFVGRFDLCFPEPAAHHVYQLDQKTGIKGQYRKWRHEKRMHNQKLLWSDNLLLFSLVPFRQPKWENLLCGVNKASHQNPQKSLWVRCANSEAKHCWYSIILCIASPLHTLADSLYIFRTERWITPKTPAYRHQSAKHRAICMHAARHSISMDLRIGAVYMLDVG